eukprot:scaffold107543_cov56-Phaeocystis_antarctica.AAC.1
MTRLLTGCGNAISEVPAARWVLEEAMDVTSLSQEETARMARGGFLAGVERFDGKCFGVSPAESSAMDPQQRLVLEVAYEALHGAGARRASLLGDNAGVFLGIERPDWALLQALAPGPRSVYAATGDNLAVAAGRLSFVLGLRGPCVSVDTACSSALVALHSGALAIRAGECRSAVASAVGLKLTHQPMLVLAAARMLSVDGRCKTWDKGANGYARSEGVGSTVLRAVSDGTSGALALCGSAVRQDGRSASLTAPNGSAQRGLLVAAMAVAGLEASAVGGVEAHGTGTALGDPTEAGALFASGLVVSGLKSSIGHTEAAAGIAGITKSRLNPSPNPNPSPSPNLTPNPNPNQASLASREWSSCFARALARQATQRCACSTHC